MWKNIGQKLMNLAKYLCCIGIIFSIAWGALLLSTSKTDEAKLSAIITMIIGSLLSWISSWVIFALGRVTDYVERSPAPEKFHYDSQSIDTIRTLTRSEESAEKITATQMKINRVVQATEAHAPMKNKQASVNDIKAEPHISPNAFLEKLEQAKSMRKISAEWNKSGLDSVYPGVSKIISNYIDIEKKHGNLIFLTDVKDKIRAAME